MDKLIDMLGSTRSLVINIVLYLLWCIGDIILCATGNIECVSGRITVINDSWFVHLYCCVPFIVWAVELMLLGVAVIHITSPYTDWINK